MFQSVLASTGGDPIEVATNLAYPLGDLILLGMVTGGVALTSWKSGRTWGALAASFILFGVFDGIYLWANAVGTTPRGCRPSTSGRGRSRAGARSSSRRSSRCSASYC